MAHLSPEAVVVLESRTEGWVVGLQPAALSLRDRPDPDAFVDAFTGTHRYVLDYLSGEVLERQPERVRTFLLRTSIGTTERCAVRRGHRRFRWPGHAGGPGAG